LLLADLYFKNNNDVKTLFLIDIFQMKNINASYGFKNGDAVIKQLHKLLKSLLKHKVKKMIVSSFGIKTNSRVTRHHSDVFAITFYTDLCETAILKIKDLIIKELLTYQFKISNPKLSIYINTTIGCSKSTSNNLIICAEKALHNAKQNFENFLFFDSNLYKNESSNNDLVDLIKYNIENKTVKPYFQAIASNENDTTVKYEALMRLCDKQGNILLPGTFLEKAKSYRLYIQLMQILINKVFDTVVTHKINVSINLDYNDIINPLISEIITSRIQQEDIGRYLTIEILESERIQDFDIINDFIKEVKKHKISIAIDDFGTGFSNYDYLLKLDIDYLKIDGSLIQKIDKDIYRNLIQSIVMFCKNENIKTIAEFVSDLKIQRYVKSLGIDYSQGFYIQKPMSIEQISGEISEG
jgi:EAL domain-containing protein (putative c-di-GMP-specific phosphodiesterase class I)/GGDEF domain-containing protein